MNRPFRGLAILVLLVFGLAACADDDPMGAPTPTPDPPGLLRILFIGNSLTAANQLHLLVDSLAAASGLRFQSTAISLPGTSIADHWGRPNTRRAVAQGHYDVVILQQGPSSLGESRAQLLQWAAIWQIDIRGGGSRPAFYAVWPEKARLSAFPAVSESYRLAADSIGGLFFPVGDTWLETWERDPAAPLYGPDDFHPSVTGSYAAAVVIVSVLAGRDATTLAPRFTLPPGVPAGPDSTDAATIRAAAQVVIARFAELNASAY